MTAEITTVIGQLSIQGGTWRGDAPNQVAVREPTSADKPGAGKGDLFILIEARGDVPNLPRLEQQLAQAVRDAYYLSQGSVTASLRRALQAAGDLLYDRNYEVEVEERVIAGAVALVMQGEDAFVAQIGPTALFAVLGDYTRRYPTRSAWLDEVGKVTGNEPALGINPVIEPNLHHLRVTPEDRLLLADSRLVGQLPVGEVTRAVQGGNVKAAIKDLGNIARSKEGSALLLSVIEQKQTAFGPIKMMSPPQLGRFLPGHSTATEVEKVATPSATPTAQKTVVEPEPLLAQAGTASPPAPVPQQPSGWSSPVAKKTPAESPGQTDGGRETQPAEFESPAHVSQDMASRSPRRYDYEQRLGQEAKELASIAPEPNFQQDFQPRRSDAGPSVGGRIFRWLGTTLLMFVILLGNGLKAIFNLVLPGVSNQAPRQAGMQASRTRPSPAAWVILRNIAIAIPLLVALIVGVSYLQKGRLREAEYRDLVDTAQSKFQQAQAVDQAAALGLMSEADALLTQAEQIKSDQPEIGELRTQMSETADQIGNVQRIYFIPLLRQYPDSGTKLEKVINQGVELYVLDQGNNRIFHHRLDDLGEALQPDDDAVLLAAQGQVVDDVTVGQLLGMTWMPAGGNRQTSDLIVLSSSGLFEYNPNWGLTTSAISGGESLVFPVAVSSFFGNFYILDPQSNQLLRYLPTADGYSAPPESYFPADQQIDLSGAVDFAIDGAIYILFNEGHIGKYLSGRPVDDFEVRGLDRPFTNPVSIFTAPNEEVQHLYVADAGNQRVVQLNKDGSFVRQFKPRQGEAISFANLQDIFVDEISSRMYILDSNNLYVANIPTE